MTGPYVTVERQHQGTRSPVLPPLALLNLQSRILDLVDTAIMAVDLEGRIIFVNPYATTLYGYEGDQLLGTLARELTPVTIDADVEAEIAHAILNDGSWEGTFDVRRRDGSVVTVHAIDSPLYDGNGELVGIVSAGMDATRQREAELLVWERTRAGQVSQFLADCGTTVASTIDYEEALQALGRSCVPFLADLCLIDVDDGDAVRRVVAAHHVQERQDLVDELEMRYPPDFHGQHPAVQALRTGTTAVSPVMTDEFLRATTRDEIHYRIVKELDFQSFMCVPLVARGHILGALTLVSCDSDRRFEETDLDVAKEVASSTTSGCSPSRRMWPRFSRPV